MYFTQKDKKKENACVEVKICQLPHIFKIRIATIFNKELF